VEEQFGGKSVAVCSGSVVTMLSSMQSLMAKEGPVIKAVILGEDGEAKELTMDMTPRENTITKVLKGKATFIGQYSKQGVAVLCVREQEEGVHGTNESKLPYPMHELEEPVFGSILMIRMDEDSEPVDFDLKAFEELKEAQKVAQENGPEEEEEEEEVAEDGDVDMEEDAENDDDEDDDDDDDDEDDDDDDDDDDDEDDDEEDDNGEEEGDDDDEEGEDDEDNNEDNASVGEEKEAVEQEKA